MYNFNRLSYYAILIFNLTDVFVYLCINYWAEICWNLPLGWEILLFHHLVIAIFFIAIFALYSSKLCYKVHIYLELLCLPGKCNPLSLYSKSPNSPNSFCLRVYLMCLYTHIHNIYLHMCTYTHTFIYTVCA